MHVRNKVYLAGSTAAALIVSIWWLDHSTRPAENNLPNPPVSALVKPQDLSASQSNLSKDTVSDDQVGKKAAEQDSIEAPLLKTLEVLAEQNDDFTITAKKLTSIVADARQSIEEREEALAHAINLSTGNELDILLPLTKKADLPEKLTITLLDEALSRPLNYQLDLYFAALSTHKSLVLQTKIRSHLAFLTDGEDLGNDPKSWETAIGATRKKWDE